MGEAARKRVEDNYLWEKRGEEMNFYYQHVLNLKSKNN